MKKRIAALVLCLALLAGLLSGCGKTSISAFRTLQTIGTKDYAIVCRKDDKIAPIVEACMKELAANGSLSRFCYDWISSDLITLKGDAGAMEALEVEIPKRTVIFGVDVGLDPLGFEEDGILWGMSVDIANAIGALAGWTVQLQGISEDEVGTQLSSGNIDCAIGFSPVGINTDKYSVFCSYLESDLVVAVRSDSEIKSLHDLKGNRIGTVVDPAAQAAIRASDKLTRYTTGATVYLSAQRCVDAMDYGWCSAVVMDTIRLAYYTYNP